MSVLLAFGAPAQEPSLEYQVKATFLYKFGDFVEWPLGAFESAAAPMQLCVLGQDPFGDILTEAVNGRQSAGRPIAVRRIGASAEARGCHILYIGRSSGAPAALKTAHGYPVLTVTDSADGQDAEGIVHFIIRDNRVRFTIDAQAAAANNLNISSKLLSIALSVRSRD